MNVSGIFDVEMKVVDHSGSSVNAISSATVGARHQVIVENIATMPRDVRIGAVLPQGTRRVEFVVSGNATDRWNGQSLNIPAAGKRTLEQDMARNNGPVGSNEPVQCDSLEERRTGTGWQSLHGGLPLQITINAT